MFLQDANGKRHLRLDYGYNVKAKSINYHCNQKGTLESFGVADHTPVSQVGWVAYQAAKYFSYAGRLLVVTGVAADVIGIAVASRPMKRASEAVAGWAGGYIGCIVGGAGGYNGGNLVGGSVYVWAEETFFRSLVGTSAP